MVRTNKEDDRERKYVLKPRTIINMSDEHKIIYSLDVHPIMNNRWKMGNKSTETIYMTALSILYSHLWYSDIELYVDEMAYKFLYMLPCKVIQVAKNENEELWMKSKINAMMQQTKPFVHLDTDVLIRRKIDFSFSDILLERSEQDYATHYRPQVDFFNQYTQNLPYWDHDLGYTYNCGILGFNNLELRDQFVSAYYDLEKIYLENREAFIVLKEQGQEPCILIEQYTLAALLNHNNISPSLLLKGENIIEQGKNADEMGYSHFHGTKKYEKYIVDEIELRLSKIFPYWYMQIKSALEKEGVMANNPQFV